MSYPSLRLENNNEKQNENACQPFVKKRGGRGQKKRRPFSVTPLNFNFVTQKPQKRFIPYPI